MRRLAIEHLVLRDIRNIERLELAPGARFNVIHGDNGQGKTNVIEAIYLVATSRSFRTAKTADMVRRGQASGSVRGSFDEDGTRREQSVGLEGGKRILRLEGDRPGSSAIYARRTPVVAFSPTSLELTMSSGAERRAMLDRVALYTTPTVFDELTAYHRAVRARQRVLEERGSRARDLDDWEELIVRHGAVVMNHRLAAAEVILARTYRVWERIASGGVALKGRYLATAPLDAEKYRTELGRSRERDARRRSASIGPHRDDLALEMNEMAARTTASQGQHRMLVLALKAAEVGAIGHARDVEPLLLLDDVSSELDATRTAAFFDFLGSQPGQVFLTTTRRELMSTVHDADAFRIVEGRIVS